MQKTISPEVQIDEFIDQFNELSKKRVQALGQLLDEQLDAGRIIAMSGRMGVTESYNSTQTLKWLGENLSLFTELPLMKDYHDPKSGKLLYNQESVPKFQQRAPNWKRQEMLTRYLVQNPKRKFPPLLVVVSESWVDKPSAEEWKDGRATRSSLPISSADSKGRVFFLDLGKPGISIFTADGQHRLLGIQGMLELLKSGRLALKRADGTPVPNKIVNLDDLAAEIGVAESEFLGIKDESMGVEFIPAVMKGETREEARQRIRSIFIHVNRTAMPVSKGEIATLDEDDGYAVIARTAALTHPLFTRHDEGDRVNWKSTALPAGSKWLTPLATLRDMAENYLGGTEPYGSWATKSKEVGRRPDLEDLEQGQTDFNEFLDNVASLPSFSAILRGDKIDEWREFPTKDQPSRRAHLLFRPLGQLVLAEAVGYLHMSEAGPGIALDKIFGKLKKYDQAGGFQNVTAPASPWYGITYDPLRKKMLMQGYDLAVQLLEYLIDGASGDEKEKLLAKFQSARTMPDEAGQDMALNYDGTRVANRDAIELPRMI